MKSGGRIYVVRLETLPLASGIGTLGLALDVTERRKYWLAKVVEQPFDCKSDMTCENSGEQRERETCKNDFYTASGYVNYRHTNQVATN